MGARRVGVVVPDGHPRLPLLHARTHGRATRMSRPALTPDRLFDRPWRPGSRSAHRGGGRRRWATIVLLLVLCLVIGGYGYITDSDRVRAMAESYLSRLVRAPVRVGGATLSVFEGLRLDDVRVYVDEDTAAPDALLFSAQTFVIQYDPRTMLAGRLEATKIVAQKPQVHLSENRDAGEWNVHRLVRRRAETARDDRPAGTPDRKLALPKVVLRNARVTISERRGGREVARGVMDIDGQLQPAGDEAGDRLRFDLQSRGVSEGLGPYATGSVSLSTGHVVARLMNFEFGRDVRSMLPAEVRQWWQRHELAGAVSMPEINFIPPKPASPGGAPEQAKAFKLETRLSGVTLAVSPEEWMGRAEVARLREMRRTAGVVRARYAVAGIGGGGAGEAGGEVAGEQGGGTRVGAVVGTPAAPVPLSARAPAAPLRLPNPGERLVAVLTPAKVTLKNVAGSMVFTHDGIEVKDVSGYIESNGLKIDGRIGGYGMDAAVSLRLSSLDRENLRIPASPRYVASLPRQVREVYEQFRPEGECRIGVRVERAAGGDARPVVSGWVQVVDGRFVFSRFPYPLRNVTGRIEFGRGADGVDRMSLNVRGNGIATGPNRDTVLEVRTFGDAVGPVGTNACGVNVRISGAGVAHEDALLAAFPDDVRRALANFDAHRTGKYPQFHGDFVTEVVRPVGPNRRWSFDTDVTLDGASGALVAFPYPLHDVTGKLRIRSGYAEVLGLRMARGDATLAASGTVAWTTSDGPRGPQPPHRARDSILSPRLDADVTTDLKLTVRGMPIDDELLAALPKGKRHWIQDLGATGRLDVDGRIFPAAARSGDGEGGGPADVEWVVGGANRNGHANGEGGTTAAAPAGEVAAASAVPPGAGLAGPGIDYDLKLSLRDATLRPFGGAFAAQDVAGTLHLTPGGLRIERVSGTRGDAKLAVQGEIVWPRGVPAVVLDGSATNLALDDALYALLPPVARRGWDETQPQGTLDAEVHYDSVALDASRRRWDALATQPPPAPETRTRPEPAGADAPPSSGLRVVLKPRTLAVTLKAVPYRLERLAGSIVVDENLVDVQDVSGQHGDAKVSVSGTGVLGARPVWDLRVGGENLPVDDDLRAALPPTLAGLIEALKLDGNIGFNLTKFAYRGGAPDPLASADDGNAAEAGTSPPRLAPSRQGNEPEDGTTSADPEIDLGGSVTFAGGKLDVGVPLTDVVGALRLDAAVRRGHLDSLRGGIDLASMKMAGRPATGFRAELTKPPGLSELRLEKMRCDVADGVMSGHMTLVYPEDGPSRYALELVVRDADVRALAWEKDDAAVKGRLNASLSLEGSWGDAGARRGRGDVVVTGHDMYRIPLVLGLLQVTNLALPISSPFSEATAVYSLDGGRVHFEQIELKASNMLMHGDGWLDFDTKRVSLGFTTDNPGGLMQVPFIKELWRGARNEMLRIQVRGTIQEPEVSARSMGTFWTTVDEVFNGGGDKPDKPAKPAAKPGRKRRGK
jgi:hypothetical protein